MKKMLLNGKIFIIFVLLFDDFHNVMLKPIGKLRNFNDPNLKQTILPEDRQPRQVVQPKWLTGPESSSNAKDAKVKVTTKNLKEAAALRDSIQHAVDEGTYAISSTGDGNPTSQIPTRFTSQMDSTPSFWTPNWEIFKFSSNGFFFPSFLGQTLPNDEIEQQQSPVIEPLGQQSQDEPQSTIVEQQQRQEFLQAFQQWCLEFFQLYKRMLNWS